jgi:hypothetical protein
MMRAEAIAWLHGLVMLDAIGAVSEDLQRAQQQQQSASVASKGSKAQLLAESELIILVLISPTHILSI